LDMQAEAQRLRAVMDEIGNVNIFLSEGAGVPEIIAELEAAGEEVARDPFGHVKLDTINPGAWFAKQFAELIGAEKTMVQKSCYFSRTAAANEEDLALIRSMTDLAVDTAVDGRSGVIGHGEENGDELTAIAFPRIAGGKAFDVRQEWFTSMLGRIGREVQPAERCTLARSCPVGRMRSRPTARDPGRPAGPQMCPRAGGRRAATGSSGAGSKERPGRRPMPGLRSRAHRQGPILIG